MLKLRDVVILMLVVLLVAGLTGCPAEQPENAPEELMPEPAPGDVAEPEDVAPADEAAPAEDAETPADEEAAPADEAAGDEDAAEPASPAEDPDVPPAAPAGE